MKATEFFVGFGPRLWSIKRGETEYGVKALPLGGYVKHPRHDLDRGARPLRRAAQLRQPVDVASACSSRRPGSIVHFLLAFVARVRRAVLHRPAHDGRDVQPDRWRSPTSRASSRPRSVAGVQAGRQSSSPIDGAPATGSERSSATSTAHLDGQAPLSIRRGPRRRPADACTSSPRRPSCRGRDPPRRLGVDLGITFCARSRTPGFVGVGDGARRGSSGRSSTGTAARRSATRSRRRA